ncbi:IS3 family transposase [uncultured Serinicoccus sp.]|uniref:IS3 family transposase n=1 Tax=uncultured Serinicoccus sp. TaxID=735514 RepID=UPI003459E5E5
MPIAPSSYYAAKTRPPSGRAVTHQGHREAIRAVHADDHGVYGVRKMHAELNRAERRIARCTVHRLRRAEGLRGITRAKGPRTTIPVTGEDTRPVLLDRDFQAPGTEAGMGRRQHLLPHLRRVGLRRARHRRVLPSHGRLAAVQVLACAPTWPWTPSRWGCGPDSTPVRTPPESSPIRTRACSTSPCGTPSGWPRPRPSPRSGLRATRMTARIVSAPPPGV